MRRIFTPVMSAARLLEDNTPSMSRGRLAVHHSLSQDVVLMFVAVDPVSPKDLKREGGPRTSRQRRTKKAP